MNNYNNRLLSKKITQVNKILSVLKQCKISNLIIFQVILHFSHEILTQIILELFQVLLINTKYQIV